MNVLEFQMKWGKSALSEKASAQSHFNDVCRLVDHQTPTDLDPTGSFFTFEKALGKSGGGAGFADVWYRGHFAWEYKKPNEDLDKAYKQLKLYAEALENPPLLIVSDMRRIRIHTNWTNTETLTHTITLDELGNPERLGWLRDIFHDPEKLRPGTTRAHVTADAAKKVGALAQSLQARGAEPRRVAHFLVQVLFCLFAEDAGLLPSGIFGKTLEGLSKKPEDFSNRIRFLFEQMRDGGYYGSDEIAHFNGGLFERIDPVQLELGEIFELNAVAKLNWADVEPAIFGTLFERSLDPRSRAQLGAHYTGRSDIERVVDPVVMTPLRRRWDAVKAEAEPIRDRIDAAPIAERPALRAELEEHLGAFRRELAGVTVLDPACGSGNFLYVALAKLLDLEKEVVVYGLEAGLEVDAPLVSPEQMYGLEINEYAAELAQVVVWIGYLQWRRDNGLEGADDPVLKSLDTIKLQDALLDLSDPANPKEATWPPATYIIGNPPFLGDKKLNRELGRSYVTHLRRFFGDAIPGQSDLCCYFFEKARRQIQENYSRRAGLLATNSIRGGSNRKVLSNIKRTGGIFLGWSDEPWILDGAAVRISIVGFDDGSEKRIVLNGADVVGIYPDLTAEIDITGAANLLENECMSFQGGIKAGPFDVDEETALKWRSMPRNPNGLSNSEVVRPFLNGSDISKRRRNVWIVDFGIDTSVEDASLFEAPFEYVKNIVRPIRLGNNDATFREKWWIHGRPRHDLREAIKHLGRVIATPRVSKHRVYVWETSNTYFDSAVVAFAREDDYFFGVLHSRAHEVWSLRMGTWLGVGNDPRYTPTTCFETFALPWSPGEEPWDDPRLQAISAAANELDDKRNAWLNPPDASEAVLKKRTLTNLYNERPTWLANLHATLDRAVWSAYGWPDDPAETTDEQILERLLALNGERSGSDSESGR